MSHQNNTHTVRWMVCGCNCKKVMNSTHSLRQYEPEVSSDSKDDEFRLMHSLSITVALAQPRNACGPKLKDNSKVTDSGINYNNKAEMHTVNVKLNLLSKAEVSEEKFICLFLYKDKIRMSSTRTICTVKLILTAMQFLQGKWSYGRTTGSGWDYINIFT